MDHRRPTYTGALSLLTDRPTYPAPIRFADVRLLGPQPLRVGRSQPGPSSRTTKLGPFTMYSPLRSCPSSPLYHQSSTNKGTLLPSPSLEITFRWSRPLAHRIRLALARLPCLTRLTSSLTTPNHRRACHFESAWTNTLPPRVRTFHCTICGAVFVRGSGLDEHIVRR